MSAIFNFTYNEASRFLISNMPNTLACVFEILVSKCKINCTFKISAKAGIQALSLRMQGTRDI